ncbi:MAG: PepSY domain-containing protein [Candidatus Loosdrechtia sp.]|uniref:PepSY domain-containing protein n=1 Tax=Candidatus Loosdrechtia sp. TaxID=3101272 RepID=UPI003A651045|nr:MAG: PepSY domain-containing protein [Candidatus Jettenia sp. AMX2]
MKIKNITAILLTFSLLLAPISVAKAGEVPTPGSKPLSEILKTVEEMNIGVITEAEFDDGIWEMKVCDAGTCQKLYIAPESGKETRRRKTEAGEIPPPSALPLSTVIRSVEASVPGIIKEVEFEDGFWEVELRKDGQKIKLTIDPGTGEARR